MQDLLARTEICDARTNIAHAQEYFVRGKYAEAAIAMDDAERHYRSARNTITIEVSGPILDSFTSLKSDLDRIRLMVKYQRLRAPTGGDAL